MSFIPPDQVRTLGSLMSLGLSFVLAIAIGTGLGWWLDEQFGTTPWLFFLFFCFGVAAAILNVYRTMSRIK